MRDTMKQTKLEKKTKTEIRALVPKDFLIGPIFAASRQSGSRQVVVGDREYTIGGFHPIHQSRKPPALDVRHARLCFAILSFRDIFSETSEFHFSFNELCKRYAGSNGGRYSRAIGDLLGDLMDTYFQIRDLTTQISHVYRILERIDIEKRPIRRKDSQLATSDQPEMWFHGVSIAPEFFGLLNNMKELQYIKLEVLTSIRSPLAQAIYLYIPSRAHHHSKNNPFEITVTKLLNQVSHPVPKYKAHRKLLVTQNRTSILSQLDGTETLLGTFHVNMVETTDKKDYKLQAWIKVSEKKSLSPGTNSKLIQMFLDKGITQKEIDRRLQKTQPLDSYEIELLEMGKINVSEMEKFLEMARALLGETGFHNLLAEAKSDALENTRSSKSPNHRLSHRIMEAAGGR